MRIPQLDMPTRYAGLYVYDFGEWSALGYTAEEIAVLLESEDYGGGKVYRIHRAWPDGRMELSGVSPRRFQLESGMFFLRDDSPSARRDLERLIDLAHQQPPPCRLRLQLARRPATEPSATGGAAVEAAGSFATCMIYPAEYEQDIASWLLAVGFDGGDRVEGGISHVADYQQESVDILDRRQLWPQGSHISRSAEQVLASVRTAVQR